MEFELERRSTLVELMEGIALAETTVGVRFRVQRIDSLVKLPSLLRIGQHFFGRGHINKLFLCHFLLVAVIRVGMPFLRSFPVGLDDFLFGCRLFHVQDLVVVSSFRLFLQLSCSLYALFGALEVFVQLQCRLVVSNS